MVLLVEVLTSDRAMGRFCLGKTCHQVTYLNQKTESHAFHATMHVVLASQFERNTRRLTCNNVLRLCLQSYKTKSAKLFNTTHHSALQNEKTHFKEKFAENKLHAQILFSGAYRRMIEKTHPSMEIHSYYMLHKCLWNLDLCKITSLSDL